MAARSPTDPPSRWTDGVRREVLPNGLTLLVQENRSAPVVAVVTHVKAGFFDEPDRWTGISHVLEHMFFKGTPRRGVGAIARETKSAGGYLNASTTYDHTSYFAVLPASGFAQAVDIQADALRHSLIDESELARELQVIIQEAKRKVAAIAKAHKATWTASDAKLWDLIAALAPSAKTADTPRLSDALKLLDADDLQDVRTLLALSKP